MKVSKDTIARTVCLGLALLNQALALFGKGSIEIADDTIYQFVSIAATFVTAIVAWWKNNSFTKEAQAADEIMKDFKSNKGDKELQNLYFVIKGMQEVDVADVAEFDNQFIGNESTVNVIEILDSKEEEE